MGGGAWKTAVVEDGVLELDDALYVPYSQTPSEIPWAPSALQRAEYEVFAAALDPYIVRPNRTETVKMHVPWTANFLEEVRGSAPFCSMRAASVDNRSFSLMCRIERASYASAN